MPEGSGPFSEADGLPKAQGSLAAFSSCHVPLLRKWLMRPASTPVSKACVSSRHSAKLRADRETERQGGEVSGPPSTAILNLSSADLTRVSLSSWGGLGGHCCRLLHGALRSRPSQQPSPSFRRREPGQVLGGPLEGTGPATAP